MYSFTEENYLKAIYFLSERGKKPVSTTAIAERLDTQPATVTDMVGKLGEKKLVKHTPYKGARLTEMGAEVAIRVMRKHRLWETFLVEKLEFGWEEVHDIAEELEHIRSEKLTERLSIFLGRPDFDPHGDPIPDKEGNFPVRDDLTLDQVEEQHKVVIQGVKDTSAEFLKYMGRLELNLGDQLRVLGIEPFDRSMRLQHNQNELNLSAIAASNIYVKNL